MHLLSRAGGSCVALTVAACVSGSCASSRAARVHVTPPEVIAARLADADALARRGCYLCLKDAGELYQGLLGLTADLDIIRKAIENDLMLALREIELRIPDSGARQRAEALQPRVKTTYAPYFGALDVLATPLDERRTVGRDVQQLRAARKELAGQLQTAWASTPMTTYFYVAGSAAAGRATELKSELDAILGAHPQHLAIKYRVHAYPPTYAGVVSDELLAAEPRFAEVHFLRGQRAMSGGAMLSAHRELAAAHALLPDSATISVVFGNVELAFSRYAEALALFDRVLAAGPDDVASLGRAKALTYLKRHTEAVAFLDELLKDVRHSPGEKYYWRAWNRLQLGHAQDAYDDATTALKSMVNVDAYRLAGIASFNVSKLDEARLHFDSALAMQAGDCDSLRYLGQIDSVERKWAPSADRFTAAAACYRQAIEALAAELAQKEADTSGLMAAHVAGLRANIKEAEALQANCLQNAKIVVKNIQPSAP